jgi:CPA1 family monovalent cation:H+ antiporter
VLVTVIVVRLAWHMSFNAALRWRHRRFGFHPPRPMLRPTVGSGLVISWAGMRGIVTVAAAIALPPAFPLRDLIVLTAAFVVLGTLLIQGLTLKHLLRALDLRDGDPVGEEVRAARQRLLDTVLTALPSGVSPAMDLVRKDFGVRMNDEQVEAGVSDAFTLAHGRAYEAALQSARSALLAMRDSGAIGDDAFHALENELDWMEVSDPLRGTNAEETAPATTQGS